MSAKPEGALRAVAIAHQKGVIFSPAWSLFESETDEFGAFFRIDQDEEGDYYLSITDMEIHDAAFRSYKIAFGSEPQTWTLD